MGFNPYSNFTSPTARGRYPWEEEEEQVGTPPFVGPPQGPQAPPPMGPEGMAEEAGALSVVDAFASQALAKNDKEMENREFAASVTTDSNMARLQREQAHAQLEAQKSYKRAGLFEALGEIGHGMTGSNQRFDPSFYRQLPAAAHESAENATQALHDYQQMKQQDFSNSMATRRDERDERSFQHQSAQDRIRNEQEHQQLSQQEQQFQAQQANSEAERMARAKEGSRQRYHENQNREDQQAHELEVRKAQAQAQTAKAAEQKPPNALATKSEDVLYLYNLAKSGKNVPGVGTIEGRLPALSGEGAKVRQASKAAVNGLIAQQPREPNEHAQQNLYKQYGLAPGQSDTEFRTGVEKLARDTGVLGSGGSGGGNAETAMAPEAKTVVKRERNKRTGEVRITYSDGTVEIVR